MVIPSGVTYVTNIRGDKGLDGTKGDTGTFASVSAVSVPAEAPAEAVPSGPESAKQVLFKIPRGLPGAEAVPTAEAVGTYLAAGDSPAQSGFDAGAANLVSGSGTALGLAVRASIEMYASPPVNVKLFGAVGDGVTDDTAAVQAAVNAIDAVGGGHLLFPPGEYWLNSAVDICSNLRITGPGAVIRKRFSTDSHITAFRGRSGTASGYGSGPSNILCEGLTFQGSFAGGGRGVTAFSLHHSENVVVRECKFIECQTSGHTFDLGGVRNVTIDNCDFIGFNPPSTAYYTSECIQLDRSKRGSITGMPTAEQYDGLPSRDLTIQGCRFLPLTIGGTVFPAPNPVGSHSAREQSPYLGLKFHDNIVIDGQADNVSSAANNAYRGWIHLIGTEEISIARNRFVSTTNASTRVIGLYVVNRGNPASSDPNIEQAVTDIPSQSIATVSVVDNQFIGFSGTEANSALLYFDRAGTADALIRDLSVERNTFRMRNCTASDAIRAAGVNRSTISNNHFRVEDSGGTALLIGGPSNLYSIMGNIFSGGYTFTIEDTVTTPSPIRQVVNNIGS